MERTPTFNKLQLTLTPPYHHEHGHASTFSIDTNLTRAPILSQEPPYRPCLQQLSFYLILLSI